MRVFAILLFLSTMVGIAYGQSTCTDASIEKFSSRGIKMGLSIAEVTAIIAKTEDERSRLRGGFGSGLRTVDEGIGFESFGANPKSEQFSGITYYSFEFLDDRLSGLSISYEKSIWLDVAQFRDKLQESVGLPKPEEWKKEGPNQMTVDCGNYVIKLLTIPSGRREGYSTGQLSIASKKIPLILKERRAKKYEEQREKDLKTFKP